METRQFLPDVNRVEVIDDNGRSHTCYDATAVEFQLQDDGRTLKVFLKKRQPKPVPANS